MKGTTIEIPQELLDKWSKENEILKQAAKRKGSVYNEADDWCQCEDHDIYDTEFWDDGEHEHVHKHHYRCGDCGKITQIG
tara:strand:- start:1001 stop:1240 length:240 start_codon:yes stop_codon:yes gene_type:complete